MSDTTFKADDTAPLTASDIRYRALFEAIDDGFCIIEFMDGPRGPLSNYVHVEANTGYQRHTGIPDIVGKTVYDVAPVDAAQWVDLYGEVLKTGRPLRFEREFIEVGRFIEVSASRVEPASLNQVSVLFRDITARKQAEAALRASEAIARENVQRVQLALAAGAIIGTWHWDIRKDLMTVDESFARAFGLDPARGFKGLTFAQVTETVHPDDLPALNAAITDAIAKGGTYSHQYRTRRTDGHYYWLEASGRVEPGPDGKPASFPGVLIDIEARRAAEDERDRVTEMLRDLNDTLEQRVEAQTADLMAAEAALRQSQKMEAVGQLTGGLAHDFNNILAAISGSLDMMQARIEQGRFGELDRYMSGAQASARRAAALTHRLLAFSRRQTLDPKPTDVNELISGMHEMIERAAGPHITIAFDPQPDLWPTLVDPNQLENALLNLCINARDAMPDGGKIRVRTQNHSFNAAEARERDLIAGDYVSMYVTDTGTGMTPDIVEKAFDPFFTTKPLGVGTGLGLSMIYGFARQSKGQVRIQSEPGAGTTVKISLPRYHGEVASAPSEDMPTAPAISSPKTVLVVDDEPLVRMLLVDAVEDLGLVALQAGDGREALEIAGSDTQIDLLVTDVGLPNGMNGRQLADAVRELRPGLKVLFVTGYAENAILGEDQLESGMEVIAKPFQMALLSSRLQHLVDDRA